MLLPVLSGKGLSMNSGRTVFSQLMAFLPHKEFQKCVEHYNGDYKTSGFSCFDQFLCMAFAQLTYRESLRVIQSCLRSMRTKLYHMGIRGSIAKSTLADANENRDWRIYADFAHVLIARASKLYAKEEFGVELKNTAYALDSTTIDLCLALFPWAKFRQHKGAVKLHTLVNLRGNIPTFIHISDGKMADVKVLDFLTPEPGAFYIMDRGYLDFSRLYLLQQGKSFFVTRAKRGFKFHRRYSHAVDTTTGLRSDQTILLAGFYPSKNYPEPLRRVHYVDQETGKHFLFLTNDFSLPALTIAQLYKARWQVELFFKWIKQHLRIKEFYGTSENAVKTQVWIAIAVYVVVAIVRKELYLERSLYETLQVLSLTLFEKTPILQVFSAGSSEMPNSSPYNQLSLFD